MLEELLATDGRLTGSTLDALGAALGSPLILGGLSLAALALFWITRSR